MPALILFIVKTLFVDEHGGHAGGKGERLVFRQALLCAARVRDATAFLCAGVSVGKEHAADGEKDDVIRESKGGEKSCFLAHRFANAAIGGAEEGVFFDEQILSSRLYVSKHSLFLSRFDMIPSYCTIFS